MQTNQDRRRNLYPANCCLCLKEVPPGEGWLYADTKARPRRSGGSLYSRFPKKVKCDRCHTQKVTNKFQVKNLDNPQPPPPRSWSAPQVRKWDLEVSTEQTTKGTWPDLKGCCVSVPFVLVHVHVTVNGERVRLAGGEAVSNAQSGPWRGLKDKGIGGKAFSSAAWEVLKVRVSQLISAYQVEAHNLH